jgi:hypothetical protein
MSRIFQSEAERAAPKIGGSFPRLTCFFALCPAVFALSCTNGAADQLTKPVALGMTSKTPAYYSVGNTTIYEVQIPVALPVRRPTAADKAAMGATPPGTPYPHAPFLRAEDESVEIHYVLSNVGSAKQTVWLLIDPWNEFVRYRPGITVVSDEVTVPNLGYEPGGPGFVLEPQSRIEGTITADDVHEIAIKLASVEKLLASAPAASGSMPAASPSAPSTAPGYPSQAPGGPYGAGTPSAGPAPTQSYISDNSLKLTNEANHIFYAQNRSNAGDPQYTPWIPPVIAGVTGFDLGLRTSESADVAVEITMSVRDLNGNRFVAQDTTAEQLGVPNTVLSPPGARY